VLNEFGIPYWVRTDGEWYKYFQSKLKQCDGSCVKQRHDTSYISDIDEFGIPSWLRTNGEWSKYFQSKLKQCNDTCVKQSHDTSYISDIDEFSLTSKENYTKIKFAEKYMYYIDLPGVLKESLRVKINDNLLIIEGERHAPYCPPFTKSESYIKYGPFKYILKIGKNVIKEDIFVDLNTTGVLNITMPVENNNFIAVSVY
jgi:HSP20 family molecular chaperone IbpA